MEELKQIDRAVLAASGSNNQLQTAEQFYIDALAIAGTRNTIAALVEVRLPLLFLSIRPIAILPFLFAFYPFFTLLCLF
jgi:hypothetical protein